MIGASFFTGIGGLDLAAEACGIRTVFMCESDAFCRTVLRQHWPHATIKHDIRQVVASNIKPGVDVFHAGFPCQDISQAGAREGIHGERSGLFFEFTRIVGDYRPRYILLENVPAILTRDGPTVIATLANMGYSAQWGVVSAADVGAPQTRKRWFCIAVDNSVSDRREGENAAGLRSNERRTNRAGQQIPFCITPEPTRYGGRKRARRLSKPGLGRNAYGLSARLDSHTWPAGSWQNQKPGEPPRITKDYATRKNQIKALGNAVVPQQAIPFFGVIVGHSKGARRSPLDLFSTSQKMARKNEF